MRLNSNKSYTVLIITIVVSAIFVFYIISTLANVQTWGFLKQRYIEDDFPAMVIKCEYDSIGKNDFLDGNQLEITDSLKLIKFYILDSTTDIKIETIKITSPSKEFEKTYFMDESTGNDYFPKDYSAMNIGAGNPLLLNEGGFWKIKLNLNKSNVAVYRYDGVEYSISDSGVFEFLEDGITIIQVLSSSDVLQIESESNENPFTIPVIIAIIGIPSGMIGTILTIKIYINSKRRERKPSIISIITRAIDEDVAKDLDWLNDITIEGLENGRFRDVPDFITENTLNEARWKDFEDEYKGIYDEIGEYVELKNRYAEEYEQLNESIKSAINNLRNQNPDIDTRIQAIQANHNESHVPLDEYYRTQIEHAFVLVIRENQNTLQQRRTRNLVAEFEDELLAIRDNPEVRGHIQTLLDCLDDLRKATALLDDIKENKRERLRHKYYIS